RAPDADEVPPVRHGRPCGQHQHEQEEQDYEGTDPDELRGPDSFPVGLRVEAPGKSDRIVRENIAPRGAGGLLRDPIRHPLIAARGDDHQFDDRRGEGYEETSRTSHTPTVGTRPVIGNPPRRGVSQTVTSPWTGDGPRGADWPRAARAGRRG